MATTEFHVGDIGTVIRATIVDGDDAVDVSSASDTGEKLFTFIKPGGQKVVKAAAFDSDGTDGVLKYTTVEGDLDLPGNWTFQAYVALTSWQGHSSEGTFEVFANLG
jgi:hypothetical protein